MFKRKKSKQTTSAFTDKQTLRQWTQQLRALTSVTQNDFQSLYVTTIENVIDYVTVPDEAINPGVIRESIDNITLALKKRQGYLLPLGADSEVIFREHEQWTYAVFSASLLNQFDIDSRLPLAKVLLPKEGYAWLYRNHSLFMAWKDYLRGHYENNCFTDLIPQKITVIEEINTQDNKTPATVETANAVAPLAQSNEKAVIDSKNRNPYYLPSDAVIESVNLAELNNNDKMNKIQPAVEDEASKDKIEDDGFQLPDFSAQDIWQWLKQAITQQQLSINQPDSCVHGVEAGLFIAIPHIIDEFLSAKAIELGIQHHATCSKAHIALTKKIKADKALLLTEQGSRIHSFCVGKWQDRNVLSGFVLDAQKILGNESNQLSVNSNLQVDPMAAA